MKKNCVLFFISLSTFILLNLNLQAQKKKILGFSSLQDTIDTEKKGMFFLPLLYYTPDTRWAAGIAGVYYFKIAPKDSTERETRTDFIQCLADYTQNKQADFWGTWNVFTRNENFLLKGDCRYRKFPDRFYEIGNNSSKSTEEKYEYSLIQIKTMFLKKIEGDLFAGFDYAFEKQFDFKYTPGGVLESGNIKGYKGGIGSSLGLVSVFDNRDNIINAYKGTLFEISSYFFLNALGSTYQFANLNLLHQKYWQIKRKHILAIQTKMKLSFGQIPFIDMATLGNEDILRGYPKNRFRDNNFLGTQIEYRFPLVWRFGMTTFAGIGDVFKQPSDVTLNSLKYSFGAGLRFAVNPAERLNIRFDYAYGKEGGYYYVSVAESF